MEPPGFFSLLARLFSTGGDIGPALAPKLEKSGTENGMRPRVRTREASSRRRLVEIRRNTIPFYEERGWRLDGDVLKGHYRTKKRSVAGAIENPFTKGSKYYIVNPPKQLLQGPHGACFTKMRDNEYSVHFSTRPKDVNTGIRTIEHLILEVLS
jgi:hypothetical protein